MNSFGQMDLTRIPDDANVLFALFKPSDKDPLLDTTGNIKDYTSMDAVMVSVCC